MPSPPPEYTCEHPNYDNVPDTASAKMPVATNHSKTPLVADVIQNSNTQRIPFGGPVMPKGI